MTFIRAYPQLRYASRLAFSSHHKLPFTGSQRAMAHFATVRTGLSEIKVPTGLFINNEFVPSVDSQELIHAVNPFTEEVICSVSSASAKDIDLAVAAARKAFDTTWGKNVTGFERSRLINKLADLIEQNAQELAELEALNNGKPVRIARDFDIGDSVQCLRYYAGWADKLAGQTLEVDNKTKFAFTKHEPIGVVGQIIPWFNMWSCSRIHLLSFFGADLSSGKVAPALAVGCTIVMKPSELTPLTALKLSELVKEAGFPPGVLNTVPSAGSVGGAALASHHNVSKVAFTGSTVTGRKIMEAAAKSNLKKVTLELGGKSPHIIFESCDLDQAANWAALGICYNSGQDCTAGSRIYVQESIHDKFVGLLVSKVKELVFGNGLDAQSHGGPVVSKIQYDRVWSYIEAGKQEGAKVAVGGTKLFTDIRPDMKIVKEEIFGPVLVVGRFKTEEEAISLANDTNYGLGAGLHSNDANQCMRVSSALDAGTINQYNLLSNNVPFGGNKQSLGSYALEEYTSVKAVHWNFGEKLDWPF
ncbi:NAD-aldehyde dehydrogenase [Mycena polygramma]|nr:NAD-aldehyde dehydrogenase [Mycena polygramma]